MTSKDDCNINGRTNDDVFMQWILLSNEEEWTPDTFNKCRRITRALNKTKEANYESLHAVWFHDMTLWKKQNYRNRNLTDPCQKLRLGAGNGPQHSMREFREDMKMFFLDNVGSYTCVYICPSSCTFFKKYILLQINHTKINLTFKTNCEGLVNTQRLWTIGVDFLLPHKGGKIGRAGLLYPT